MIERIILGILLGAVLICSPLSKCNAQKKISFRKIDKYGFFHPKQMKYSSLGFGFGSTHYSGDLSPLNFLSAITTSIRWNIALSYSYTLTPKIQIGANATYLRLAGDDFYADNDLNYIRNLHFRNDLKQLSLFFQYHPFSYSSNYRERLELSPYFTAGIGYYFHNPLAKLPVQYGDDWVELAPLHTEGQGVNVIYPEPYKLSGFVIPIGLGLRYRYSKKLDFSIESTYCMVFTDYLDDVSGIYPNPLLLLDKTAVLLSNRSRESIAANTGKERIDRVDGYLANKGQPFVSMDPAFGATGTLRGSNAGNDAYMTVSLKIHYLWPIQKIKCPKVK
jgi:hypothetical protein